MSRLHFIDEYDDHYCKAGTNILLTNFAAIPCQVYCDAEDPLGNVKYVRFEVKINGVGTATAILDVSGSKLVERIHDQIPSAVILNNSVKGMLEAHIRIRIAQAANTPLGLYCGHSGLIKLGGNDYNFAFVAGDKVICAPSAAALHIDNTVAGPSLCVDEGVDRTTAVRYICELVAGAHAAEEARKKQREKVAAETASVLMSVWLYTILSAFRSEINRLNITTFPALLLCGQPGTGKTTTANRLSLLYGRAEGEIGIMEAGSTEAATIQSISKLRDQVVVIDDLAHSTSYKEEKERQNYVASLLRYVTNNTPNIKYKSGNSIDERVCQVGCVFTGEFLDMSASEIERLIIVHMDKRLTGGSPRDRSMAGTAFYHFLYWALPNLREHLNELDCSLTACDAMENPRLQKTGEMLIWAHQLFLRFACDVGAIRPRVYKSLFRFGMDIVSDLIQAQIRLSETKKLSVPRKSLAHHIAEGYNAGALHTKKKKKALPYQDSYEENGALYVPVNVLLEYLKTTPYAYLIEKTLGKKLRDDGLLPANKEGRTATKGKDGARWIKLELSTLREKG